MYLFLSVKAWVEISPEHADSFPEENIKSKVQYEKNSYADI
jgi:hypothetical protein